MKIIDLKLSRKTIITISIVALIFITGFATYLYIAVNNNIKKMIAMQAEMPTYYPAYPKTTIGNRNPELVKRGETLTKAGDCIACHTNTPVKGATFGGGLAMPTPFGTIYSPNITPDKETGIGNWTDEQFEKAMRQGISPAGHYYYPAFPYYYFNKISSEDIKAIKAYLDSIPAVSQTNRDAEMVVPFNIRFLQLGWRILFFRGQNNTGPIAEDSMKDASWNRGHYLVEGLGHCAMCHSPSYNIFSESLPLGAPIKKYNLTGAKIQGYLAPNISKSNIGSVSDDELIRVFTEDRMVGGSKVEGPMLEVNHDSLSHLSHEDLQAITTYLKSVESQSPPVSGGPGQGTYEGYCAGCHSTGAGGAPKFGDATAWDAVEKKGIETVYTNAIRGINGMPAKGTCISCSDTDIKTAVDYMIAEAKGGSAEASAPAVPLPKPLTLQDGKNIYEAKCTSCHANGVDGAPKPGDMPAWTSIIETGFYDTYKNVTLGRKGHPPHGGCADCSDAELKAAIKYMMQASTTKYNYTLW